MAVNSNTTQSGNNGTPNDSTEDFGVFVAGLEPVDFKFSYKGKNYWVDEPSEDAAVRWKNEVSKATRISDGKLVGVLNMADTEPFLVSMCTFMVKEDGSKLPITSAFIRNEFPSRLVKKLYNKLLDIGDLKPDNKTTEEKIADLKKELTKLEKARKEELAEDGVDEEGNELDPDRVTVPN